MEFWFRLLLGHFAGNYLFSFMNNDDFRSVVINGFVYSLTVCLFLMPELQRYHIINFLLIFWLIFFEHFILIYTDVTKKWLQFLKKDNTIIAMNTANLIILFFIFKILGVA